MWDTATVKLTTKAREWEPVSSRRVFHGTKRWSSRTQCERFPVKFSQSFSHFRKLAKFDLECSLLAKYHFCMYCFQTNAFKSTKWAWWNSNDVFKGDKKDKKITWVRTVSTYVELIRLLKKMINYHPIWCQWFQSLKRLKLPNY